MVEKDPALAYPSSERLLELANRFQKLSPRGVDCSRARIARTQDALEITAYCAERDTVLGKLRKFANRSVVTVSSDGDFTGLTQSPTVETGFLHEISHHGAPGTLYLRFYEKHIEIWSTHRLERVVRTADIHKKVFAGGPFATSTSYGNLTLYTAAAPQKKARDAESGAAVFQNGSTEEFEKTYDFGEQYPGVGTSRLFSLNVESGEVEAIDFLPDKDVTLVQYSEQADVFCLVLKERAGNDEMPPMGVYYCYNRPSRLYLIRGEHFREKNPKLVPVSSADEGDFHVHDAKFSPDGKRIIFVSNDRVAAHNMTMRLRTATLSIDGADVAFSTILDIVPGLPEATEFPGLYIGVNKPMVAGSPFLDSEGRYLLVETTWGSYQACIVVDTTAVNTVFRLDPPVPGSMMLKAVSGSQIAAVVTSPSMPPRLFVATLSEDYKSLKHVKFLTPELADSALSWSVQVLASGAEAIVVLPTSKQAGQKPPVLCFPHGGPHTAATVGYSLSLELLVQEGMAVILVNYRGSTGRGQAHLELLPGKCGEMDVNDCIEAVEESVARDEVDRARVGVLGGSHGGFLAAHLTAQRPDMFRVAVIRNPVVNIATMVGGTDIPDWCYYESGIETDKEKLGIWPPPPSASQLEKMLASSPIQHVGNVTAPTMLMVGEKDIRVPPQQAMEWLRALRRQGVNVQMRSYPESNHAIDNSPAFEDSAIHQAAWAAHFLL